MRALGIISEYNPFHNGHRLHIEAVREKSGCDCVIAVMNGSFSQRGEPMLYDKFTRTRMALAGGCDIVIELPAAFGIRPAEQFAYGGVSLLSSLGCVEYLGFGCETDDISAIEAIAGADDGSGHFREAVARGLDRGESLARARGEALEDITGISADIVNAPNMALAAEYMRALRKTGSDMKPVVVKRENAHSSIELGAISSASAVRNALYENGIGSVKIAVPQSTYGLMLENDGGIAMPEALDTALLTVLRGMSAEDIGLLPDVTEGLENRLWSAAQTCGTRQDIIMNCKCKRYTYTRISRILAHALIRTTAQRLAGIKVPGYARVLGIRQSAKPMLSEIATKSSIPLVTGASEFRKLADFDIDARATDMRAILAKKAGCRASGMDYTEKFIIIDQ